MGRYTGIENAKVSEKLPNLTVGRYLLKTDAVKDVESRTKGGLFIAEFTVMESSGEEALAPGQKASVITKLSLDTALGNIKQFASALTGEPMEKITSKMIDNLVSKSNPAAGTLVRAEAFVIAKKDGSPFTKVVYSHVTPDDAGKAAQAAQ